jgi:nickel-dependent lactate racemase
VRRNGAVTQRDAEQVTWLLGVLFSVQVVPGPADSVLYVLAGRLERVLERGRQLARQAWEFDVPRRADLVVAAIEGGGPQQTWDNVGRAVAAARRVVNDHGVIALCTELTETPGSVLRMAAEAESSEQVLRRLHKRKSPDITVAEQWACALERGRIYLLSRLNPEDVEGIGAAHVASAVEMGRLIDRSNSCVLLSNAQCVLPTAADG